MISSKPNSTCVAAVIAELGVIRVLVSTASATVLDFTQCRQSFSPLQNTAFDPQYLKNDDEGTAYYAFWQRGWGYPGQRGSLMKYVGSLLDILCENVQLSLPRNWRMRTA
jgi:hypothetical protein